MFKPFQVTTCQWTLVIELFELNNPKNLELRQTDSNTQFCCCDDDGKCNENREDPKLDDCDRSCDTFVTVTLQECEPDTDCAISITSGTVDNSPSVSPSGHIFSFDLDRFPNEVGHNYSLYLRVVYNLGSHINLKCLLGNIS